MKTFKRIIKELTKRGETIATMESCTGGGVADAITSIEDDHQKMVHLKQLAHRKTFLCYTSF